MGQAELVRRGDASPAELVDWAIERIEALNPELNAVVVPMFDRARSRVAAGVSGPFAGVPYLLKDLVVEVAGVPFAEASRYVEGYVSSYTSELARRLEGSGLVVVGRTNAPEFGMAPHCEPVLYGATHNPWDLSRSTSGSSGGSAAAVAAGLVPAAHGNDLGGSIRYPASTCGLFGLKPTRARNPLGPEYGDAVSGWAVEHALTVSVRDSAVLLDATHGPAPGDPYPAPPPDRPFVDEVGAHPGRLRIAYTRATASGGVAHPSCLEALDDALALLESLGHDVEEAELPGLDGRVGHAIGVAFNSATAWVVDYWRDKLGRDPQPGELEPLTELYWHNGRTVTAGEYLMAIQVTQAFSRQVAGFLATYDLWLTPTMSQPPARLGELVSTVDDVEGGMRRAGATVGYAGVVANLTGNPAMSVPLFWDGDGLPIGVHFLGRYGDEATLFRLAAQLETARPWAGRRPGVHATRL